MDATLYDLNTLCTECTFPNARAREEFSSKFVKWNGLTMPREFFPWRDSALKTLQGLMLNVAWCTVARSSVSTFCAAKKKKDLRDRRGNRGPHLGPQKRENLNSNNREEEENPWENAMKNKAAPQREEEKRDSSQKTTHFIFMAACARKKFFFPQCVFGLLFFAECI